MIKQEELQLLATIIMEIQTKPLVIVGIRVILILNRRWMEIQAV